MKLQKHYWNRSLFFRVKYILKNSALRNYYLSKIKIFILDFIILIIMLLLVVVLPHCLH